MDFAKWTEAIMLDEWVKRKGSIPTDGSLSPDATFLTKISELSAGAQTQEEIQERIEKFLRKAILAWILRCTAEGVTAPLYVNKALLHSNHMEWMNEHKNLDRIPSHKRIGTPYADSVYAGVINGENDFLESTLSPNKIFISSPDVHWVTVCFLMGRFVPPVVLDRHTTANYNGQRKSLRESVLAEIKAIREDTSRKNVFINSATRALQESMVAWLEKMGLGISYKDGHETHLRNCGKMLIEGCWMVSRYNNLHERDLAIIPEVRGLDNLSREVPPIQFPAHRGKSVLLPPPDSLAYALARGAGKVDVED